MIGLIKKDLFMIKSNVKFLVIMLLVYFGLALQGEMDISFLLPFLSVVLMMSTFSYEAFNKWDAYAITLPDGRKNSVKAKYISTLILILFSTLVVTILSIAVAYSKHNTNYEEILMVMLGYVFATVMLEAIMYPAIYKYGVERARIGIFVIVFGIILLGGILKNYFDLYMLIRALDVFNDYLTIALPITMILMLFISYLISSSIYMKKEY